MNITVLGGTGLIGTRVVTKFADLGHRVAAASLSTGVDLTTGEGLDAALVDTDIVLDVSGRPVTARTEHAAWHARSGEIIRRTIRSSDVRHHVLLSADGTDRLATSGFFLGKLVQENMLRTGSVPFTILRSAPFFETLPALVMSAAADNELHLPPLEIAPVAADDVAAALVAAALETASDAIHTVAGPDRRPIAAFARQILAADEDTRHVRETSEGTYYGVRLGRAVLSAADPWRRGKTRFDDWQRQQITGGAMQLGYIRFCEWRVFVRCHRGRIRHHAEADTV